MKDLIPVKFNEEVVITTKMLAEVYECKEKQIKQNHNNNKDKFIELASNDNSYGIFEKNKTRSYQALKRIIDNI